MKYNGGVIIVVAYPDRDAGNDPKIFWGGMGGWGGGVGRGLVFNHQCSTFVQWAIWSASAKEVCTIWVLLVCSALGAYLVAPIVPLWLCPRWFGQWCIRRCPYFLQCGQSTDACVDALHLKHSFSLVQSHAMCPSSLQREYKFWDQYGCYPCRDSRAHPYHYWYESPYASVLHSGFIGFYFSQTMIWEIQHLMPISGKVRWCKRCLAKFM